MVITPADFISQQRKCGQSAGVDVDIDMSYQGCCIEAVVDKLGAHFFVATFSADKISGLRK